MFNHSKVKNVLNWFVFFAVALIPLKAWSSDPKEAGIVVTAQGDPIASNSQQTRHLTRGMPIYVQDKIVLNDTSKIQIKFTDGGIINLIPASEYTVDSYSFNEKDKNNENVGSLAEGGFRALSGAMSKKDPSSIKIKTPVATIGLRGTIYQIELVNGSLVCGCEKGSIDVSTTHGSITIGDSFNFSYGQVSSADNPPETLNERPSELTPINATEIPGGLSYEEQEKEITHISQQSNTDQKEQAKDESDDDMIKLDANEGKCI
ncbi:MAG: FecR family protein [Rhabdochlamydiaceae bacterium]